MTQAQSPQSKGGKAVARKFAPLKCPKCEREFTGWENWHVYLGHLGLHGLADKYFEGNIIAAQKHLRQNGLARLDPAPWNKAWPKYKPLPGKEEPGPPCGCMAALGGKPQDFSAEKKS